MVKLDTLKAQFAIGRINRRHFMEGALAFDGWKAVERWWFA